jgi:hypothetical protein
MQSFWTAVKEHGTWYNQDEHGEELCQNKVYIYMKNNGSQFKLLSLEQI